jgi:hypothetical protein
MLTGKAPFESKASDPALYWVEMRSLHERATLPALAPLGVSVEVEKVALRATAKRLEDRYQSADEMIEGWYVERFLRLRQTAFRDPASYFHRYATLSEEEAEKIGLSLWRSINRVNLKENILPTRQRADLILRKGADHAVETVALRKL